jgi:hypothetical protein
MSTPIIEYIAANIKTTIDGITTTGGYNQTLIGHRPRRVDFIDSSFNDKDVLIVQKEMDVVEGAIQSAEWRQHFDVIVSLLDADAATDTIDTRINVAAADIMKALLIDHTRGGYAIDTTIHKAAMMEDESGITSGVVLDISVLYRTKYTDPYTAI